MCGQCVGLRSGLLASDETEMGGFQVESQAAPLLANAWRLSFTTARRREQTIKHPSLFLAWGAISLDSYLP